MSNWTAEELDAIDAAEEVQVAARRPDGSLRPYTKIWVVRAHDGLYVRSWAGHGSGWIRSALRRPEGRIQSGGLERDVRFELAGDANHAAIDQAYRSKYAQYGSAEAMASPAARRATLRLVPR